MQAGLPGLAPTLPAALRIALAVIHQPFPRRADGQQLQQGLVVAALQACLPAPVGAPGGPAQAAQQQTVEPGFPVLAGQAQVAHGGFQRCFGLLRQLGDTRAQVAPRAEHAEPTIRQHAAAPGLIQPDASIRAPVGLLVVEPGGAALADLLSNQRRPAGQGDARFGQVFQQRQAVGVLRLGIQGAEQLLDCPRLVLLGHCLLQVTWADAAGLPGLPVVRGGQAQAAAGTLPELLGDGLPGLVATFPQGADGDHAVQRPGRRDAFTGLPGGAVQGVPVEAGEVFVRGHGRSPVARDGACGALTGHKRKVRRVKCSSR